MNSPIDSRQLRAFVILARTGNYTQAAKELFVTHSAVHHSMRALENQVGCRLLDTVGKRVVLTEAGEALLHYAKKILQEIEEAQSTLSNLGKWGFKQLRIGAEADTCRIFLPLALSALSRENFQFQYSLRPRTSGELVAELASGEITLAFGELPALLSGLQFTPLWEDQYHIIVDASHPWGHTGFPSRNDLPKQPFLLPAKSTVSRRNIDKYYADENIVLNTIAEVECTQACIELIKSGLGAAILPRWATKKAIREGTLISVPMGRKHLTQVWGVFYKESRPLNHLETTFLQICKHQSAEILSGL